MGGLIGKVSSSKDGLMPKDGFIYRGEVNSLEYGGDYNNCIHTGFYRIHNGHSMANSPGFDWGGLIVFNVGGYKLQLAYSSSSIIYKFRIADSTWRSWANINYTLD